MTEDPLKQTPMVELDRDNSVNKLADTLVDAIAGLSHEIARRVKADRSHYAYALDRTNENEIERVVRVKAQSVLIDYFLGRIKPRPYVIKLDSIMCMRCGMESFNHNDIAQRYCGHCHRFHTRYPDDDL